MNENYSKDCLGLCLRISVLHQTWKWLHQTIALHEYLISVTAASSAGSYGDTNLIYFKVAKEHQRN
ncbi:uncharacterized protein [Bactrocera oleae]|uniref:uncharacterized protein n=1 Tax=Bactrocera oleae TaxID=104688 RepID=UPI0006B6EC4E|nr:uncharacterized protein LOC106622546 [Bactrocera oleae]XP_036212603.1 uncharacterized protein LOC106622546 [Bactrocera oleae]XP_036212604.1 uncharacterized protein LOC106622546 [Bactrocera oleae]